MREGEAAAEYFREQRGAAESILGEAAQAEGSRILAAVETFIGRYVMVPPGAPLVLALWAIATHLVDCFDSFPYLSLSSPLPRCGKTRLLEVLELLCARPWRGTAPTEAALFRFIEANRPTLLLDEVEGLAARKSSDATRPFWRFSMPVTRRGKLSPDVSARATGFNSSTFTGQKRSLASARCRPLFGIAASSFPCKGEDRAILWSAFATNGRGAKRIRSEPLLNKP